MSKFEDYIISVLKEILPGAIFIRELPVKKLFKDYVSGRDRYDIVSKTSKIIFECHGRQHEVPIKFGKEDSAETLRKFTNSKYRDFRKEMIARENNWTYVIIWYNDITNNLEKDIEIIKQKIESSI